MKLFNVEKHFIISDEAAEPRGIILLWFFFCKPLWNQSLLTNLIQNLCITCDKFLVSSYTRQLLLGCAGRAGSTVQPSQNSHLINAWRRMTHTPAVSPRDFLQWHQQTQIQEGFWKKSSFPATWQTTTLKAARQMLIQRARKQTAAKWLNGKYLSSRKQPPSKYIFSRTRRRKGERYMHKKKQCNP